MAYCEQVKQMSWKNWIDHIVDNLLILFQMCNRSLQSPVKAQITKYPPCRLQPGTLAHLLLTAKIMDKVESAITSILREDSLTLPASTALNCLLSAVEVQCRGFRKIKGLWGDLYSVSGPEQCDPPPTTTTTHHVSIWNTLSIKIHHQIHKCFNISERLLGRVFAFLAKHQTFQKSTVKSFNYSELNSQRLFVTSIHFKEDDAGSIKFTLCVW